MAYWTWGRADHPHVVVCAHGLTRQGLDFDTLAQALTAGDRCRVVSVDVVGRGRSDWLGDPMGYQVPQYVADMVTLFARLHAGTVDWVGTSMGGLIGLGVAALAGSPLRRLVVNDVGPTLDPAGLARIGQYVGRPARWATLDEAADALWSISQGFGPHTREQWLAFTAPQLVAEADGSLRPRCDPAIAVPFASTTPEAAATNERLLWAAWDRLALPTLLLRGADSDLLSHATAQAMTERGPRAKLVEFAGVGHAPTLIAPDQVAAVRDFLLGP
ncbi:MAG TPA: alpha/beta hydrolase [Burkholderiaceae bacterium]|nr:alpha/beta hydrolase [Burkholderiaceae bacterium]